MEVPDYYPESNFVRTLLEFTPFSSLIDSSFWHEINRIKLEELKLEIKPIDVFPSYSIRNNVAGLVSLNYESFQSYDSLCKKREQNQDFDTFYLNGKLLIFNTKEEFDRSDKRQLIKEQGKFIWDSINDEQNDKSSEVDSNLEYYLTRFFMIVYGDFKAYDFTYWAAYPALCYPPNCFRFSYFDKKIDSLQIHFSDKQWDEILQSFLNLSIKQRLFFAILLRKPENHDNDKMITYLSNKEDQTFRSEYIHYNYKPEVVPFDNFWSSESIENLAEEKYTDVIFCLSDCSEYSQHPGWLLKNYLAYLHIRLTKLTIKYRRDDTVLNFIDNILYRCGLKMATINYNSNLKKFDFKKCFYHRISIVPSNMLVDHRGPHTSDYFQCFLEEINRMYIDPYPKDPVEYFIAMEYPKIEGYIPSSIGWERNKKYHNRLVPNTLNCANSLDPESIATNAIYLNLRLMKWRLVQNLDLEKIKNTKCLLLGSGTLGCNVARTLVSWGVNNITMVDNKNVSFSNPARQSLYTYQDAISNQQSKAETAAKALKSINPLINSKGVKLNIKMPGHFFEKGINEEMAEIEKLENLIDEHDVIFLTTDSRESRYLPTIIASAKQKIVINIALGFDSFLVQRFGVRIRLDNAIDQKSHLYPLFEKQQKIYKNLLNVIQPESEENGSEFSEILLGTELGCYFCNDVLAPNNSTKDRTLDQQCTVTRPGLSMIASGYAVELLMSILQHPAGPLAPALANVNEPNIVIKKKMSELFEKNDDNGLKDDLNLLETESLLGVITHECRGFLSFFEHMNIRTPRLKCCTACSYLAIDEYRNNRKTFLNTAINDPLALEALTGIDKFHQIDDINISDCDNDDFVELKK